VPKAIAVHAGKLPQLFHILIIQVLIGNPFIQNVIRFFFYHQWRIRFCGSFKCRFPLRTIHPVPEKALAKLCQKALLPV